MVAPPSHARATPAPRAWGRVRHGVFLLALRAFDAWMGANEKKREAVSLLTAMVTSLLTIFAFAGLFLAALKALWTQAYPWVKQLAFIAPDVAFVTGLTASGLLLCCSWKLMIRTLEAEFRWLHPDNQQAWMDAATDSLLLQRIRRFEKPLLTCSPLERCIADGLWQEQRVARAKAGILESRLAPVTGTTEAPKRARL